MFSEPERKRSLQFLEFSFWEVRNTRSRLSTLRKKFRASKSFYINRSLEKREVLAVSDGELNSTDFDGRGSDQSLNSLPSVQSAGLSSERSVASWAVSFERLLKDNLGIEYFTEFLKKEYSAENIYFWKSCEKFQSISPEDTEQLLQESRRIYDEYLSSSSLCPVNVDQQALITEEMLEKPSPNLFKAQQLQIFNLMKFDSYARFVKSPLYQECMLSEVEGHPLPKLNSAPPSLSSSCTAVTSRAVKKKKLRPGKSLPIGVEASGTDNLTDGPKINRRSFKKKDRKGNVTDTLDGNGPLSRRKSEGSLNSATSLDLNTISSFSGKENDSDSLSNMEREAENRHIKYCCVYLPDGTASLTAVRPGLTIREMLAGVCEKRGYSPSDVKVYLAGNEQKVLALDQECMILTDKEVMLENRISFHLQIETLNKSLLIVTKPTKTIHEALQTILKKYGLDKQHFVLYKMGESHAVDQCNSVNQVAGQTLVLQTLTDMKDITSTGGSRAEPQTKKETANEKPRELDMPKSDHQHQAQAKSINVNHISLVNRPSRGPQAKHKAYPRNYDIEGLVEMLNRVQSSRADDQRGLLCKQNLVLPDFLKIQTDDQCDHCHTTCQDNATELLETVPPCPDVSAENCSEQTNSKDNLLPSSETAFSSSSHIHDTNNSITVSIANSNTVPTVTISNLNSKQTVSYDQTCAEDDKL
ncbi:regulator of G-protein signaling 14 isoform X2 [Mixophyes fleayi]|uniref:regulator of G-protein signaling 14 isoform X2 n=1 Tax=Mixophyes fleayi TaxID=3061075 RepID=UPI003F4D7DC0